MSEIGLTVRDAEHAVHAHVHLLERREHIARDLQDRCEQWAVQRAAPPVLPRGGAAYRFAGFGTHEIVTYYYLVRELL